LPRCRPLTRTGETYSPDSLVNLTSDRFQKERFTPELLFLRNNVPSPTEQRPLTYPHLLDRAFLHRQPPPGVILHSDRGVQYACKAFRQQLNRYQMVQSMIGKGNCYDNAITETVFKTLKTEWMYGKRYRNQQELRQELFDCIEVFYNRKRLHSTLGYTTPTAFLQQYQQSISMAS